MRKIKVAVLMGGKTPEHEISLITGREVVRNLNKSRYDILPVVISRTGERWQSLAPRKLLSLPDPLSMKGTKKDFVSQKEREIQGMSQLAQDKLDVVLCLLR